jgi:membrane dipeptidase
MRFALAPLLACVLCAQTRQLTDAEVMRVHRSILLIDTHNDVAMKTSKGFDIGKPDPKGSTDILRLKEGNVGAEFFAAYVPARYARLNKAAEYARTVINSIRNDIVARHPETFSFARTADEIVSAHKRGKIAALIGLEGGHAIEDNFKILREFYESGVRYMTLTHSNTNNWADSSGDISDAKVTHHGGLAPFGKEVIREMNKIGMMVDISHVADETFWDALEASQAPIFASHSSCRALSNARRNMSDEMIKALAKKGGVIQINFACDFLNERVRTDSPEEKSKLNAKFGDDEDALRAYVEGHFARATLADVVDHIDHVVKIAGIDAVGIGSDFDGVDCTPVGLEDVSKFPNLTRALLEKGYTQEQIGKIYGGNTLRLMREVEKAAKAMQGQSARSRRSESLHNIRYRN